MKLLIDKLDSIFQSETIDEAYSTYSKFINFSRKENIEMSDYIIEYEHLYKRMRDFEMILPDAVLAFKLLDGANISDEERKLALTLGKDLKYDDMKSALKRLFNKSSLTASNTIKEEETFYNKHKRKTSKDTFNSHKDAFNNHKQK